MNAIVMHSNAAVLLWLTLSAEVYVPLSVNTSHEATSFTSPAGLKPPALPRYTYIGAATILH